MAQVDSMNIWLVTIGEPVPTPEQPNCRLHRTGHFAKYLASVGHSVTWWTSTFDHSLKKHFYPDDFQFMWEKNLSVRFIRSSGYKKSISLARIKDHQLMARRFAELAPRENRPDVILASLTPISLSESAVKFGKKSNIPVAIDVRDLWPDIIPHFFPNMIRPFVRLGLVPMMRSARSALQGAKGIVGITDEFVNWGLEKANRSKGEWDSEIPFTYTPKDYEENKMASAREYWAKLGFGVNKDEFVVLYLGSLGVQPDIPTAIEGTRRLNKEGMKVRLLVCGEGDYRSVFENLAKGIPEVHFAGWIDGPKIYAALDFSSVGLDPLPDRFDFMKTINNKAIEYMYAGLPILLAPNKGLLHTFLGEHACGKSYATANVDEYVAQVKEMISNKEKTQEMGRNGRKVFNERFASEKVYERLEAYLLKLKDSVRS